MEWATTEKYDGCVMMAVDATHHRLSVADTVEQQTLHPEFLVFYFHDSDTNHVTCHKFDGPTVLLHSIPLGLREICFNLSPR